MWMLYSPRRESCCNLWFLGLHAQETVHFFQGPHIRLSRWPDLKAQNFQLYAFYSFVRWFFLKHLQSESLCVEGEKHQMKNLDQAQVGGCRRGWGCWRGWRGQHRYNYCPFHLSFN